MREVETNEKKRPNKNKPKIKNNKNTNFENVNNLKSQKSLSDFSKINKLQKFRSVFKETEVPDPYFGGDEGFDHVLDILEDSVSGFLDSIC